MSVELERLLRDRTYSLTGRVDALIATRCCGYLELLQRRDEEREIKLLLNCEIDELPVALVLIDWLGSMRTNVAVRCLGAVSGLAPFLAASGARGKRIASPHTLFRLRRFGPSEVPVGALRAELERINRAITDVFAQATGRSPAELLRDIEAQRSFTAEEAVEYGFIDAVA